MPNPDKHHQEKSGKDMISNLPSNVTEHIQQLLPLEDAAKTSILSKCWRYRWLSCPHLILGSEFYLSLAARRLWPSKTTSDRHSDALNYSNIISKVLLHHIGPIHKFCLYTPCWLPVDVDISHWLQFVSRQGVKDFTLYTEQVVPSCLFTFEGFSLLTHLTLCCDNLLLPSMFRGFPCLISLKTWCHNGVNNHEILIRSCPQLEIIDIGGFCESRGTLTIHAPKLHSLVVYTKINFVLEERPNLQTLSMKRLHSYEYIATLFHSVPGIENLILQCGITGVRDLDGYATSEKCTFHFKNLRTLELVRIPLDSELGTLLFVKLLHGSPQLEKLKIYEGQPPSTLLLEDLSFINLKNVEVICTSDLVRVLPVIKFLLASCPALEVMTVDFGSSIMAGIATDEKLKMAIEMLQFHRASTRAKVVFKAN